MAVHEECGVFGVFSEKKTDAAGLTYYGLYALQHRGQEACGIAVNDDGQFYIHKDTGLVGDVFNHTNISGFPKGNMAVGHVRYSTSGGSERKNCQPLEVNHQRIKIAIAHNGNLSNAAALRSRLELTGAIFHTTSDTEIIAYIITKERLTSYSLEEAVSRAMNIIEGAYSLVIMSPSKLIICRDPYGFRPLCYGKRDDGSIAVASETCALKAVGAELVRDVLPGEILVFSKDGIKSIREHCGAEPKKICIFEYIYFARPDSEIDGISVHEARKRAGMILADCYPADADVVVGVPDSGLDAALGFSLRSGIPYGIGFLKNKYIRRTFISPNSETRIDMVKIKLSAISETVRGKSVVLVDDSIVRGTTSKRIVKLFRDAGAERLHMRVSAPPFLHPCYYGTDIDSERHLIACKYSAEEIAKKIGADSLGYLPKERLSELIGSCDYCSACFDGKYPTSVECELKKEGRYCNNEGII